MRVDVANQAPATGLATGDWVPLPPVVVSENNALRWHH